MKLTKVMSVLTLISGLALAHRASANLSINFDTLVPGTVVQDQYADYYRIQGFTFLAYGVHFDNGAWGGGTNLASTATVVYWPWFEYIGIPPHNVLSTSAHIHGVIGSFEELSYMSVYVRGSPSVISVQVLDRNGKLHNANWNYSIGGGWQAYTVNVSSSVIPNNFISEFEINGGLDIWALNFGAPPYIQ